jgi:MmyB-like transcription regulator ligand binding domain
VTPPLIDVNLAPARKTRRRPTKQRVRPSVQHILDAITGAPALVQNGRLDVLAANPLGCSLYSEMYVDPVRPVNHARFVFLNFRRGDKLTLVRLPARASRWAQADAHACLGSRLIAS